MIKGKEWFIKELHGHEIGDYGNYYNGGYEDGLAYALKLAHQLDEPEVLSQEWIDDESMSVIDTFNRHVLTVPIDRLENLLVPKQEKVKIPYFIEEHIQTSLNYSEESTVVGKIENYMLPRIDETESDSRVLKFFNTTGNIDLVALAMITENYEVEEEQKYVLSISITDKASKTNYETYLNKRGIFHSMENDSFNSEEFNWTEEEIKGLESGEILFEHFAVKVEALKE